MKHILIIILSLFSFSCQATEQSEKIKVGAEQTEEYLPALKGQRVAVLANHTAMVGEQHLVDMLISKGVKLVGIFSPEHGFRGGADASMSKIRWMRRRVCLSGRYMMATQNAHRMRRCRLSIFCL